MNKYADYGIPTQLLSIHVSRLIGSTPFLRLHATKLESPALLPASSEVLGIVTFRSDEMRLFVKKKESLISEACKVIWNLRRMTFSAQLISKIRMQIQIALISEVDTELTQTLPRGREWAGPGRGRGLALWHGLQNCRAQFGLCRVGIRRVFPLGSPV